jgi:hypothetical protein
VSPQIFVPSKGDTYVLSSSLACVGQSAFISDLADFICADLSCPEPSGVQNRFAARAFRIRTRRGSETRRLEPIDGLFQLAGAAIGSREGPGTRQDYGRPAVSVGDNFGAAEPGAVGRVSPDPIAAFRSANHDRAGCAEADRPGQNDSGDNVQHSFDRDRKLADGGGIRLAPGVVRLVQNARSPR